MATGELIEVKIARLDHMPALITVLANASLGMLLITIYVSVSFEHVLKVPEQYSLVLTFFISIGLLFIAVSSIILAIAKSGLLPKWSGMRLL